jgi:hypothetical protein
MTAYERSAVIKQTNHFSVKILRDGSVEVFEAKYFTLEPTDYPGIEGKTWTFTAVQQKKVGEDLVENKTITIIVPHDAETGTYPISDTDRKIYIDYVSTSDDEPYIHVAEKGMAILTFTRKGDEMCTISGQLDVTVDSHLVPPFKISGAFYYSN